VYDDDSEFEVIRGIDGRPVRVLRDGGRMRVSMQMRDHALHDARAGAGFLHDGHGHEPGHRPGFVLRADIANEQRRQAHADYIDALTNAWRDQPQRPPTGFGSKGARGPQVGDLCTCRGEQFPESFGAPGTLQMHGGELVCVPDAKYRRGNDRPDPASDRRSATDSAYAEYDAALREAWRNPK
jgi:hypothetical protein